MASSKKRAQGGGRTANSEPRVQVFRDFNGCNFELSPKDFTLGRETDEEQSDLQMNFVVVQNNAGITSNKTIETRNNLIEIVETTSEQEFTGVSALIGNELYLACSSGDICIYNLLTETKSWMSFEYDTYSPGRTWQSFISVDNKFVGFTAENSIWYGDLSAHLIKNTNGLVDPSALTMSNLVAKGNLSISATMSDTHPYRVAVAYAYVNIFGPTAHSPQLTFYANYPVNEWHGGRYLQVSANNPTGASAVELYYTTGNSSTLLLAGRVDFTRQQTSWKFNWYGYLDATNMWPVANLIAPTENFTKGVPASHATVIDSRVYFWGDNNNPQRLYIGGNPGNLLSVSPGTGGGFVDVEPGSGQEIRVVTKYKTQSGASIVTILTDSENTGLEQRFNLVENSVSLSNEQSMKSWQAEQVAGSVGCKSYYGGLVCEDGLYAVSRYGIALTTMTMEYNSQIRTNYISDAIKPVFTDRYRSALRNSILLEIDGVLYFALGGDSWQEYESIVFCYDIDLKAWWTVSLDVGNESIVGFVSIDYEEYREGLGIITPSKVYMLPLTLNDDPHMLADFDVVLQTGELSTMQPQQNWFYLSQLEFRFDYFVGFLEIELTGIDQFGRKVSTQKYVRHKETVFNEPEWMRVDLRLQSYQIRITGRARFRLTHFMAKLYTMSAKQGLVWGFNDRQSFRFSGDIHPEFVDYNDIKRAVIP